MRIVAVFVVVVALVVDFAPRARSEVALAEECGERIAKITLATPDLEPGVSIGILVEGCALGYLL